MNKSQLSMLLAALCAAALVSAQTTAPPANRQLTQPVPAGRAPGASVPVARAVPAAGPAPTRVGIINVQQAILSTREGQNAANALQGKFNPRKTALEKRQTGLTALQDQLKKGGATMSDAAKEKIMRDIDANTKTLNREAEDLNADVEQDQNKIMNDLGQKLMAVLDQYAAQNGIAVVLDVSNPQAPVFWADKSTLITDDIVALYNQAHPAAAAANPAAPTKPAAAPPVQNTPQPHAPRPPVTKKQ